MLSRYGTHGLKDVGGNGFWSSQVYKSGHCDHKFPSIWSCLSAIVVAAGLRSNPIAFFRGGIIMGHSSGKFSFGLVDDLLFLGFHWMDHRRCYQGGHLAGLQSLSSVS